MVKEEWFPNINMINHLPNMKKKTPLIFLLLDELPQLWEENNRLLLLFGCTYATIIHLKG